MRWLRKGWRVSAVLQERSWTGQLFAESSVNNTYLHNRLVLMLTFAGHWRIYLLTILYVIFININPSGSVNPFSLWLKAEGLSVSKIVSILLHLLKTRLRPYRT